MKRIVLTVAIVAFGFVGFGVAFGSQPYSKDEMAREVRLIGKCNGKYYAAMEEDQFPSSGCEWIEGIREDVD